MYKDGGLIYALAKLGIYQSGQAKPYQTADDSKGGVGRVALLREGVGTGEGRGEVGRDKGRINYSYNT